MPVTVQSRATECDVAQNHVRSESRTIGGCCSSSQAEKDDGSTLPKRRCVTVRMEAVIIAEKSRNLSDLRDHGFCLVNIETPRVALCSFRASAGRTYDREFYFHSETDSLAKRTAKPAAKAAPHKGPERTLRLPCRPDWLWNGGPRGGKNSVRERRRIACSSLTSATATWTERSSRGFRARLIWTDDVQSVSEVRCPRS